MITIADLYAHFSFNMVSILSSTVFVRISGMVFANSSRLSSYLSYFSPFSLIRLRIHSSKKALYCPVRCLRDSHTYVA